MKRLPSTLFTTLILVLSVPAVASYPETERNLDQEIDMCVARIGAQANYDSAARVVHRVVEAEQVNLAEQQFRIDTLVLADDDSVVIRAYNSTCVTMGLLKVVRFHLEESIAPAQSAALLTD